jgi:hypothetical protein
VTNKHLVSDTHSCCELTTNSRVALCLIQVCKSVCASLNINSMEKSCPLKLIIAQLLKKLPSFMDNKVDYCVHTRKYTANCSPHTRILFQNHF